jgi:hypothetical protein
VTGGEEWLGSVVLGVGDDEWSGRCGAADDGGRGGKAVGMDRVASHGWR